MVYFSCETGNAEYSNNVNTLHSSRPPPSNVFFNFEQELAKHKDIYNKLKVIKKQPAIRRSHLKTNGVVVAPEIFVYILSVRNVGVLVLSAQAFCKQ